MHLDDLNWSSWSKQRKGLIKSDFSGHLPQYLISWFYNFLFIVWLDQRDKRKFGPLFPDIPRMRSFPEMRGWTRWFWLWGFYCGGIINNSSFVILLSVELCGFKGLILGISCDTSWRLRSLTISWWPPRTNKDSPGSSFSAFYLLLHAVAFWKTHSTKISSDIMSRRLNARTRAWMLFRNNIQDCNNYTPVDVFQKKIESYETWNAYLQKKMAVPFETV